jgi:hypothetical protein
VFSGALHGRNLRKNFSAGSGSADHRANITQSPGESIEGEERRSWDHSPKLRGDQHASIPSGVNHFFESSAKNPFAKYFGGHSSETTLLSGYCPKNELAETSM